LLLQHSIGYKSEGDKFIDTEITKYDIVNFYDKSIKISDISSTTRHIFNLIIGNTDKGLCDVIKDDLQESTPILYFHKIEDNEFNPVSSTKVDLTLRYLIKKFEAFNNFKFSL
jgi:hypothetical protein